MSLTIFDNGLLREEQQDAFEIEQQRTNRKVKTICRAHHQVFPKEGFS